jgi:4-diphosphocytidyl-2-C-methyl-D-erythritol kinase
MKIPAHAKINLDLHILGLRPDGYHEISTVMQGLALADELDVTVSSAEDGTGSAGGVRGGGAHSAPPISLTVSGADLPADRSNLCWKAAEAMLGEAVRRGRYSDNSGRTGSADGVREGGAHSAPPLPAVRIALDKRIPFAAGLGGGSSDAAAVLLALNELLGLDLPLEILSAIGKKLGADVPFCLFVNSGECAAAHCTGIGDFIDPVPAKERFCLLVKPDLGLSTPAMYRAWDEMGTVATNDFEPIAEYKYPEIRALKADLLSASQIDDPACGSNASGTVSPAGASSPGARSAAAQIQMSGSGPTFFALFDAEEDASRCFSRLEGRYPAVLLTKTLA